MPESYRDVLVRLASGEPLSPTFRPDASLVALAQRHGLVGALAKSSDSSLVRAIHVRQLARESVMRTQLAQVLQALADRDIRATPIKGPALSQHYQDPSIRHFGDIDLIVERHRLEDALSVLNGLDSVFDVPPKRPKADKRDVLVRDASGVRFNLDLHWDLFSYTQVRGSADGATSEAWSRAVYLPDDALGPRWELPEAHRLTFLSTHAVLDHRFRLILFRDLLELAREPIDWSGLVDMARRWRLRSTTYLALWMARRLLGAEVPEEFLMEIRPPSLALRYLEYAIPRADLARFDGHAVHPINLAAVTLHDDLLARLALVARAPRAFPGWRRRVAESHEGSELPRTLILASTNRRRGAEVFSERLRSSLKGRGWVVDAIALRGYQDETSTDLAPLVDGESHPGRFNWRIWLALRKYVREYEPDLVVANGGATLRYALAATWGTHSEVAYISIGEPNYWIRSLQSRVATRLMLRATDRILAVSSTTRDQTIQLEPSVANRTFTTYTGLPEEFFHVAESDAHSELRILLIGSLTEEKDPSLALHAVAGLNSAFLCIVGDGPMRAELAELVKALDLEDRVHFAGSVSDVRPHLRWADVLLLTSRSEGLPGAVLEASAAGVPTVGVDVGGVAEAVLDGVTGFVVPRSADSLTARLRELDEDRGLLKGLGQGARDRARKNFSMDAVADTYARVLRGLSP